MAELPANILFLCRFRCPSSNSIIRYNIVKCHCAVLTFLQGGRKLPVLTHLPFFQFGGCVKNEEETDERKTPRGTGWGRIELGLTEAWWEKTEGLIMKENKPYWLTGLEDKEVSEWVRKRKRVVGQQEK